MAKENLINSQEILTLHQNDFFVFNTKKAFKIEENKKYNLNLTKFD